LPPFKFGIGIATLVNHRKDDNTGMPFLPERREERDSIEAIIAANSAAKHIRHQFNSQGIFKGE
jgi:hypothetical protein